MLRRKIKHRLIETVPVIKPSNLSLGRRSIVATNSI